MFFQTTDDAQDLLHLTFPVRQVKTKEKHFHLVIERFLFLVYLLEPVVLLLFLYDPWQRGNSRGARRNERLQRFMYFFSFVRGSVLYFLKN